MANRFVNTCALVLLLACASTAGGRAEPADTDQDEAAQNKAPVARFQAGLDKAAHLLENDPRLGKLTHEQPRADVTFVAGNMVFARLHEMGHAHIQDMGLPVLAREEDAADTFATLRLLKVGAAAHNVLVAAAKPIFYSGIY